MLRTLEMESILRNNHMLRREIITSFNLLKNLVTVPIDIF